MFDGDVAGFEGTFEVSGGTVAGYHLRFHWIEDVVAWQLVGDNWGWMGYRSCLVVSIVLRMSVDGRVQPIFSYLIPPLPLLLLFHLLFLRYFVVAKM